MPQTQASGAAGNAFGRTMAPKVASAIGAKMVGRGSNEALWDGKKPLTVRPASEDEIDAFDDTMDEDEEVDDDDEDQGINVLFLVPVDEIDEDDDSDVTS